MRAQPDQRRGFSKLLEHRPGVFIKTDSDNGERLVRGETLSRRTVDRVSDGHRIHLVLGGCWLSDLFSGDGVVFSGRPLSNPELSRNLTGLAGGMGAGLFSLTGSTTRGVTNTISSLLLRLMV